jgi:hypothetical protein
LSIRRTLPDPDCAADMAAENPAFPPPTTTTSQSMVELGEVDAMLSNVEHRIVKEQVLNCEWTLLEKRCKTGNLPVLTAHKIPNQLFVMKRISAITKLLSLSNSLVTVLIQPYY